VVASDAVVPTKPWFRIQFTMSRFSTRVSSRPVRSSYEEYRFAQYQVCPIV
jgi:hypothetical protein